MPIFLIKKKNKDTLRKRMPLGTGIFRRVSLFLKLVIIFGRLNQKMDSKCVTLSIKLQFLPFYLQKIDIYYL